MRKIFLTAIALLSIASAQVFGMYGTDSYWWIGFLTDANQFRARLDHIGFTLGNDTIKGTFGFHNDGPNSAKGGILTTKEGTYYDFQPTISMGLAYTSSLISVGVGYNATIGNKWDKHNGKTSTKKTELVGHTPVLVLNAMDNAFRMAIPIQVVHHTDKQQNGNKASATAVSMDAQFRYYTGLEALPQVRLYLRYGNYNKENTISGTKTKETIAETFGFQFRLIFGSVVEEVALSPIIKIDYNTALGKQHNIRNFKAINILNHTAPSFNSLNNGTTAFSTYRTSYGTPAWDLTITPALGLSASSDIVTLYLEPSLGFKIVQDGDSTLKNVKEKFNIAYAVYGEIYLRPIQNLEWYFEADLSDNPATSTSDLMLTANTGITWYLPQF